MIFTSALSLWSSARWAYSLYDNTYKDYQSEYKDDMENDIEIRSKLKFIGKLQEGEKINVRHMFVQPSSLATRLSRTFLYVDNKKNGYNFISRVMRRSFEILNMYLKSGNSSEKILAKNIIVDIQDSRCGINNFKMTYSSDISLCCDIETLIQDVDAKLGELRLNHPDLFSERISNEENF